MGHVLWWEDMLIVDVMRVLQYLVMTDDDDDDKKHCAECSSTNPDASSKLEE